MKLLCRLFKPTQDFKTDGMSFKCRLAMGVGAVDFRSAFKVIGA
jgi:hypothetical protein